MKLTEELACQTIMREQHRRAICLPRYTPIGWWECDVAELTASGYLREYEVKLTRSDFRADAGKGRERFEGWGKPKIEENKHALLAAGSPTGPNTFYFVTSRGLIDRTELPIWAGLIELGDRGEGHRPNFRWSMNILVPAPKIHRVKAAESLRGAMLGNCYYRLHTEYERRTNSTPAPLTWQDTPPPATNIP